VKKKDKPKREGTLARHSRLAREAWTEPRTILTWSRDWAVRLWITKGGGFYGLGYVIAFVSLEVRSLSEDLGGDNDLVGFMTSQFIDFIIRFSVESFLNALLALIWPLLLLLWGDGLGIVILIGAWIGYRFAVRPLLEEWFPELKRASEAPDEPTSPTGSR
jgi:hypothetical protein